MANDMIRLGGGTDDGEAMEIDLDRLIGSHACIVANSGAGKSGLIRRILEETHGLIQHVVLDVEDEFHTLREKFDYVVAGPDGDAPATITTAAGLARASLEHGFSLVAQINDLGDDAPMFVADFLESLISAPRHLWRPLLVVVDETQRFAPSIGNTEATSAMKALLQRGRKRGFTAILASLAMSEINPRLRGLVNNWMLGRVGQSLDRDTVARQLGFRPSSAEAKGLQALPPRTFWGFGPALTPIPTQFRVDDVATTPVRPGQAQVPIPPAPQALRAILKGLKAPSEAGMDESTRAAGGKTDQALIDENQRLRGQVAELERAGRVLAQDKRRLEGLVSTVRVDLQAIIGRIDGLFTEDSAVPDADRAGASTVAPPKAPDKPADPAPAAIPSSAPASGGVIATKSGVQFSNLAVDAPKGRAAEVLRMLAETMDQHPKMRENGVKETTWAFLTGTNPKTSTWRGYKAALRPFFAQNGNRCLLTPAGEALFDFSGGGPRSGIDVGPDLVRMFIANVKPAGSSAILAHLLEIWPRSAGRSDLAAASQSEQGSSTFRGYLAPLNKLELIEKDGDGYRVARDLMEW